MMSRASNAGSTTPLGRQNQGNKVERKGKLGQASIVYAYIWRYWKAENKSPSVSELCNELSMDSLTVRACLAQLQEDGLIVWQSRTERGIVIVQELPPR